MAIKAATPATTDAIVRSSRSLFASFSVSLFAGFSVFALIRLFILILTMAAVIKIMVARTRSVVEIMLFFLLDVVRYCRTVR